MKHRKQILAGLLVTMMALLPSSVFGINKLTPTYMFGVVTSFNNSVVYFTEIQRLDSTWINTKNNFLYSRENYSFQLRDYMKGTGVEVPTCTVIFAEKRSDVEKKYLKFKKRYTTKGNYILKNISPTEFSFSSITPDTPEAKYTKEELKEAIKKEKAELKAAKVAAKKKAKTDKKEKALARKKAMEDAKQRAKELKKS
jgi:hypothetical protein